MAIALALRFRSNLTRTAYLFTSSLRPPLFKSSSPLFPHIPLDSTCCFSLSTHCLLSTVRRQPTPRPKKTVDKAARARQLQAKRLWTYDLSFVTFVGLIVIVLNNFKDQLVFYVTPTDAIEKLRTNPTKARFRLGSLVLEGSVVYPSSSPSVEFVITDLITDIVVRHDGSLPDLFREGDSTVAEGFVKPLTDEIKKDNSLKKVSTKARSGEYYFSATEVLAKHDEKYMPKEVAASIEKNKKILAEANDVSATDEKPNIAS